MRNKKNLERMENKVNSFELLSSLKDGWRSEVSDRIVGLWVKSVAFIAVCVQHVPDSTNWHDNPWNLGMGNNLHHLPVLFILFWRLILT